jgi:serine/threonine protein kinase
MFNITTLTGLTIGQYTLKEQLGAGGMGVVYRGYQPTLDREVAVKILPPSLANQEGYMERFTREARTAAALEHAHIVPIYDYGTQQELSYVVMRLLTGGSLAQRMQQRLKENLPMPSAGEVSRMLKEIASALDYAHSRGVVHRDIKAGNIMFDNHGSAYLVDFGIAKLVDNLGLTGSGLAVGTPTHMSPEQWRGEAITPATDQYALGVVIFELIAGKLPFESSTAYALMHKHLHEPPTPLHTVRPDLSLEVERVLQQAMAKDPQERYPTATAFANEFEQAVQTADKSSTQFFTFEVQPVRLKADGELFTANLPNVGGNISATPRTTADAAFGNSIAGTPAPDLPKAKNKNQMVESPEVKEIRKAVERRLNKRRELLMNGISFACVVPMLWGIWAFTGANGFPWPLVVMLGWGLGFALHAADVFLDPKSNTTLRERELRREFERRGIDTTGMNLSLPAPEEKWYEKLKEEFQDEKYKEMARRFQNKVNSHLDNYVNENDDEDDSKKRPKEYRQYERRSRRDG